MREMRRKHLLQLRANCSSPDKDKNGSATNSLVGTLRFLAVADYAMEKSVDAFRQGLIESARSSMHLFDRFDAGDTISPSYVSMMAYKELFNALASGDKVLSETFAAKMGGRNEIERQYDRPFDIALGYSLKSILVQGDATAKRYVEALEVASQESENADFRGYAMVLRAILNQDAAMAEAGFRELIAGHKRQSKGGGLFKDTADELLSVWGVGLANLAHMRGLMVEPNDPLVPTELLI